MKNLLDGTETQVTRDGEKNKILNGITDWVYEEEFAQTRLMAWSPDSRALAFVRTDESGVQEYPMQMFCSSSGEYDDPQEVYPRYAGFKYPVAGADNSKVSFRVWKDSSTAIRDLQSLKNFESFTNQTEWSSYGKELNKQALAQVIDPLGIDENVVGKTVTFTGGAEAGTDAVSVTAVELTIE